MATVKEEMDRQFAQMTDAQDFRSTTLHDEHSQFTAMIEARKVQVDPPWHKGFGRGSFSVVVGVFSLLMAWATWGRASYGEQDVSPVLMLIVGMALVAYGLWQREVRVMVPLYGVVIDGQAKDITWADKWSMERRQACQTALLKSWQTRHPGAEVELRDFGHAWVYVPRSMVEHAAASALVSR